MGSTLHSVQDGDTFTLKCDCPESYRVRIRLADIDAPERGELLWGEARACLRSYLQGLPIELEWAMPEDGELGAWNRPAAYVWAAGVMLNRHMIMMGLAVVWTPAHRHAHTSHLYEVQEWAKHQRMGVWALSSHRLLDLAVTPVMCRDGSPPPELPPAPPPPRSAQPSSIVAATPALGRSRPFRRPEPPAALVAARALLNQKRTHHGVHPVTIGQAEFIIDNDLPDLHT